MGTLSPEEFGGAREGLRGIGCESRSPAGSRARSGAYGPVPEMSLIRHIVQAAGGFIRVLKEDGDGAMLWAYLPPSPKELQSVTMAPEATPAKAAGKTILVVESDSCVRECLCEVLRSSGYRVLDAQDAPGALSVSAECLHPIDLLLTDVVLPGSSGQHLAERAMATRPEMKVLYTSAYSADTFFRHGMLDPGVAFIQKPFTLVALARRIRELLNDGGASHDAPSFRGAGAGCAH